MSQTGDPLTKSKKDDFHQIKNLIENSLMHDWAISIEYAAKSHQNYTEWLKWDKKFYGIKDSDHVLEEIMACCKNNPGCSMKLVCEQFSPECRLIYCIRRKQE